MNRQLYQMGGMGMESLSPMQPAMQPAMESAMYNPLESNYYSGTPMMMASGGIANLVKREKYGIGSKLKKFVRNIIPNEIAEIAVKAAPFVAPFNPILAAGMAGIGGFDQTGRIGSSLKSAALTYGAGQIARGIGGAGFQEGFNPFAQADFSGGFTSGIGSLFSSPMGTQPFGSFSAPTTAPVTTITPTQSNFIGTDALTYDPTTGQQLGRSAQELQSTLVSGGGLDPREVARSSQELVKTYGVQPGTEPGYIDLIKKAGSFENVPLSERFNAVKDLSSKALTDLFTKPIPGQPGKTQLDKSALYATFAGASSYYEALQLAKKAGIPEGEFSEADYQRLKVDPEKKKFTEALKPESFGIRPQAAGGGLMNEGVLSIKLTPAQAMAMGGRMGYADGTTLGGLMIKLDRPVQSGDPLGSYYDDGKGPLTPGFLNDSYGPVNSLTGLRSIAIDRTQPVERKMGLFAYPDGSYPDGNMTTPIQTIPRSVSANPVNDLYKYYLENSTDEDYKRRIMESVKPRFGVAMGGPMGSEIPVRQNQGGVSELDLRAKGGYIPVGIKEKADDVPAMLSKNEFVFTADAVRGAGNGSINSGAQKMYKLMKSLEKKVKQNKVA